MNDEIAKLYDQAIVLEGNGDYVAGELDIVKFAALVAAHEREACAKFVENCNGELGCQGYLIRARGEKP